MSKRALVCVTGVLVLCLCGCSEYRVQKKVTMEQWETFHRGPLAIPLYAKNLKGVKICLDPGHGGDAHLKGYKAGPKTGVREAAVNWRVAVFLRQMLEEAGAEVIMTRDGDEDVSLSRRVQIANENNADIFVSLHHNATGSDKVNYTTTWFHADPDFAPANLDLARHIQIGVEEELRLPQTHPRGLMSDYLMYQGAGFGVIRGLNCVACLCEASFHSHAEEEKRLANAWYNQREAYGYFLGIARYVNGGMPFFRMTEPRDGDRVETGTPVLKFRLNDGLSARGGWAADRNWILEESLQIRINGKTVPFSYDPKSKIATVEVQEKLGSGTHTALVLFQNIHKNHTFPKPASFVVALPATRMEMVVEPDRIPASENAWATVRVKAYDEDGKPVADDTIIDFSITEGELLRAKVKTLNGEALNYYRCPWGASAQIIARSGKAEACADVWSGELKEGGAFGVLFSSSTGLPVPSGKVAWHGGQAFPVTADGRYAVPGIQAGCPLMAMVPGRFGVVLANTDDPSAVVWKKASLLPVAGGVLAGKSFVLDPRYGGEETGAVVGQRRASECNRLVALYLMQLLENAGAQVRVTRTEDITMSVDQRLRSANQWPSARYIRIEHELAGAPKPSLEALRFPGSTLISDFAAPIIAEGSRYLALETGEVKDSEDKEIKDTRGPAVSFIFRTLDSPAMSADEDGTFLCLREAYVVYRGIAAYHEAPMEGVCNLEIRVVDAKTGQPQGNALVELGGVESLSTDKIAGMVCFEGLPQGETFVAVSKNGYKHTVRTVNTDKGMAEIRLEME